MPISRRDFMKGMAVFSGIGLAPKFLTDAYADPAQVIQGFNDDRVLVVVQLGGGNDGLNTIVPFEDDLYHRARPQIGLKPERLIKLNDLTGINDAMRPVMPFFERGELAVIQGVGYPNPDRSHFRSMEIWHTGSDSDEYLGDGWIGRYFDNNCAGAAQPQVGLALDAERPQAFGSALGYGVATTDPGKFGWNPGKGADNEAAFLALNAGKPAHNPTLDFLRHTTANAVTSSEEVRAAAKKGNIQMIEKGKRNAGPSQLDAVAGLIRGGLATRIYYVSTSGFDTHSGQVATHDRLLGGVAGALARFQDQLEKDGTADRVTTMVFSEFGRRVNENGSGGTDHGTAAPMFLMGKSVKGGIHGAAPNLGDLDGGDLKYSTDFRQVYTTLLEDWLHADPAKVLDQRFDKLPLLA
ncbi:MAG: DUF1501 domain-containing protein [Candidatus Hydrogenedentes bacterium]|nr:DUF1501 domain-containing protein [Candidatus Hydrogenedentota bacterium]